MLRLIILAEQLAIVGALVVDGTGSPASRRTVILESDRIIAVKAADAPLPPGARIFDAKGMTLTPGLIDVHTHLTFSRGGKTTYNATPEELLSHEQYLDTMEKEIKGASLWRRILGAA